MLNLGQYMEMAMKFKIAETIINDLPFLIIIAVAGIGYIGAVVAEKIHGLFVK